MQVLLGKILLDEEDKPIEGKGKKQLTLREACIQALIAFYQDENIGGEEKFKRYEVYQKIKAAVEPMEISVEDVALLKKLIGKAYGPVVVGQCWNMLENKDTPLE